MWWRDILAKGNGSHSLTTRLCVDLDIWVDVSTDWGISLLVVDKWAAWQLSPRWKSDDRDIGWAESVTLELVVMWLIQNRFSDCEVTICGDNTEVIGASLKADLITFPKMLPFVTSLLLLSHTISLSFLSMCLQQ